MAHTGHTVLVAGASGLIGHAALRRFAALDGWSAIGVSRRAPAPVDGARIHSLDLDDAGSCAELVGRVGAEVTHLVYAAQYETPGMVSGWFDNDAIARNLAMLRNLFEPLLAAAPRLEHVSLLQGSKAYGIHHPDIAARVRTPLRERDPRQQHPNFYFEQEDYLRGQQSSGRWGLTVWRPTVVYGDAAGVNVLRALAVYAALERERGSRLDYPGGSYEQPFQEAVDCELLAEALAWAATAPTARDRTFNLTNGDTFTWRHTWAAVAEAFGMHPGEHRPMSFAQDLPARDAEWAALVSRHGLDAPPSIEQHVGANSLIYADWMLGSLEGVVAPLNSTIAVRQAGFDRCLDTEDMFRSWFDRMQRHRVVPAIT
jgi:nucleoside-diphosphate-sugar epimerase